MSEQERKDAKEMAFKRGWKRNLEFLTLEQLHIVKELVEQDLKDRRDDLEAAWREGANENHF